MMHSTQSGSPSNGLNDLSSHTDHLGYHPTTGSPATDTTPYSNFWTPLNGNNCGNNGLGDMTSRSPSAASSTSLVMQVKAANVSPPSGSPHHATSSPASAAAAAAAAAAASHHMHQQAYSTYHHPSYYPGVDLSYFGGQINQQYTSAAHMSAAAAANQASMFRTSDYDAYSAASVERYQLL